MKEDLLAATSAAKSSASGGSTSDEEVDALRLKARTLEDKLAEKRACSTEKARENLSSLRQKMQALPEKPEDDNVSDYRSENRWVKKARKEEALLRRAKEYYESQKKDVKRRQKKVQKERASWKQEMHKAAKSGGKLGRSKRNMLRHIKHSLDSAATELNSSTLQLRKMGKWLHEREKGCTPP